MENKEKYLLGEWNGFVFRMIEPEDYDQVLEFAKEHFMSREPTCKELGYTENFGKEVASFLKIMLSENMSFMAIHKESNELAGIRVTYKHIKDEPDPDVPINTHQAQMLIKILNDVTDKADIFNRYNITFYADFFVTSTAPKFCRQGLVTEMYRRSLKYLKAEGFPLAKSVFTSPYTRKAVTNLGFEELSRITYDTVLDENGESLFPGLTEDMYAAVFVKKLDEVEDD